MIQPDKVTNFNRSYRELEEFAVFCWFCKAAKSEQVAAKLNALIEHLDDVIEEESFFDQLKFVYQSDLLVEVLSDFKLGKYEAFRAAFLHLASVDLRTVSLFELMQVHGMGAKIARMFLLHSRPCQEFVCLDVHLLKEARNMGIDAPRQTPSKHERYLEIEEEMISKLKNNGVTDFAKFDLDTWVSYAIV